MPKISTHLTEIGGIEYLFKATDGLYSGDIAAATGITKATIDEQDLPEYTTKELLQKGILFRLTAITSAGGRASRISILVAKDKLQDSLDTLQGKTFSIPGSSSGTITSVGFKTKVVSRG